VTLALACISALIAAVIQRITGLGFVLVLVGPIVLLYGALEGVTIGVLLALPPRSRQCRWCGARSTGPALSG